MSEQAYWLLPKHPVLQRVINHYGAETRQAKAAEEAAELAAALCKGLTSGELDTARVAAEAVDMLLTLSMLCAVMPELEQHIDLAIQAKLTAFAGMVGGDNE